MDKARLANQTLSRAGWKLVGDPPDVRVGVFIGAPHTSNWDFPLMLAMTRAKGLSPHFLMKREAFRGPVAPVLRALGGVAVDRRAPQGLVAELVERASSGEPFHLVIAPEGTRTEGHYWKSGFYKIASQAHVPIVLGACDGPSRTLTYNPVALMPSGDIRADMDVIRAFYAGHHGVHPAKRTEPRLREEDLQ
jgi:1-acyl-sn-glycerol-3-phosphate acyltransferase